MKRKRTIRTAEVTVETDELILSRAVHEPTAAWCARCGARVHLALPEEAARVAGVTPHTIYRWIDAASVHFVENGGRLLVCLPALFLHVAGAEASSSTKDSWRTKP